MNVYVFGNEDVIEDNLVFTAMKKLEGKIPNVQYITVKPNEDLPFANEESVIIMDTVMGVDEVRVITEKNIDKLILSPRTSVHDFDLGFQLKYLKKLGKLREITIIGLPKTGKINHLRIQSILRKLVAQDMQGS